MAFYRPPPDVSMLPPTMRPTMVTKKFEIGEYDSQQVGGRRKHVSFAIYSECLSPILTNSSSDSHLRKQHVRKSLALTELEEGYLKQVYGSLLNHNVPTRPFLPPSSAPVFSLRAQVVGASSRFKLVQNFQCVCINSRAKS